MSGPWTQFADDSSLSTIKSWRKPVRSSDAGGQNCVEVGANPHLVAVRDTKDRAGGVMTVPHAEWASWLTAIKTGALDG